MIAQIKTWQVFYLYCHYAQPVPKNKYLLIVSIEPILFGFMINSKINAYATTKPNLKACYAPLKVNQHPFLDHDSYADCTTPCFYSENDLKTPVGIISTEGQQEILESVKACRRLSGRYKKMVL